MKLKDILDMIPQTKKDWPNGVNFKNKSIFIGISCGEIIVPIDLVDSKDWGFVFESKDKEFNDSFKRLTEEL